LVGRALFQKGSHSQALPELRFAFDHLEGSELASVWLAEALNGQGQMNAALRVLDHDTKIWPFHVISLLTAAKLRLQMTHANSPTLWSARKGLQLAMSRLPEYLPHLLNRRELGLSLEPIRTETEMMAETQRLMQQVDTRLAEITADRSE